jgi:hypothetical protein
MADADRRMQVDERRILGRGGIAVRHADDHRFLQAEHIFKVGREVQKERQLRRAGIAEDPSHAKGAQQLQGCVPDRCLGFRVC